MRFLLLLLTLASPAPAQVQTMVLASTTSTQNSGLFDYILPIFREATGIEVFVVAVGTGQALRIARNGDADAILVHHRASEDRFVADGFGVGRVDVMYNDFVIIGPRNDPAGIAAATSVNQAFSQIFAAQARFVSRGDDSGTHKFEQEIWAAAGLQPAGNWYLDSGSGMGASLNLASGLGAYILADRSTWLLFNNRGDLDLLFEGGAEMFNPYGYIRVNPERFAFVRANAATVFGDWLVSPIGQAAIADYRINGAQVFCPNALAAPYQPQDQQSTCPASKLQRQLQPEQVNQ